MNTKAVIRSQYHAALDMLAQAIEKCPADVWQDPQDKNKFWHVAYHAIFYVHLYSYPREADFKPWPHQRENYHVMGGVMPWNPSQKINTDQPYTQVELLAYIDFCRAEVDQNIPQLDLAGASGFDWLPFNKLELQFYNIRHLQQHTGELCDRLGERHGIDVDWVGRIQASTDE